MYEYEVYAIVRMGHSLRKERYMGKNSGGGQEQAEESRRCGMTHGYFLIVVW